MVGGVTPPRNKSTLGRQMADCENDLTERSKCVVRDIHFFSKKIINEPVPPLEIIPKLVSYLKTAFPLFEQKERKWARSTMEAFLTDYLRTLDLLVPAIRLNFTNFQLRNVGSVLELVTTLKDWCVSPMTILLRQEGSVLRTPFTGQPKRYLRRFLRSRISQRKAIFCNTLWQLKRVAGKMPLSFIKEEEWKCVERLSLKPRQDETFQALLVTMSERILDGWEWKPDMNKHVDLTLKACWESGQEDGGVYGQWQRFCDESQTVCASTQDGETTYASRIPLAMKKGYYTWGSDGFRYENRYPNPTLEQLLLFAGDDPEASRYRRVVGIAEPLKVRTITLGHWWESALWSDFQKSMARRMAQNADSTSGKDFPGNQMDGVFDALDKMEEELQEECVLVSDDASAATDSIHHEVSIGSVIGSIPPILQPLFKNCFRHESLMVKDEEVEGGYVETRKNTGQLMGDRRSFPLLTLIHLSAKYAFLDSHDLFLRRGPNGNWYRRPGVVRVNGDDGVIGLPKRLVGEYFKFMEQLWSINRVKTFVHHDFFSFNSKLFRRKSKGHSLTPTIRWNLIRRLDKNGEKLFDPRIWNVISDHSPSDLRLRLFKYFLPNWKEVFEHYRKIGWEGNWFLPEITGGLGLNRPHGWRHRVTRRQNGTILLIKTLLHQGGTLPPNLVTRSVTFNRSEKVWGTTSFYRWPESLTYTKGELAMSKLKRPRGGDGRVCVGTLPPLFGGPIDESFLDGLRVVGSYDNLITSSTNLSLSVERISDEDQHTKKQEGWP